MVVDSILLHAESGPNDHRKDAPLFIIVKKEDATVNEIETDLHTKESYGKIDPN